MQGIFINGRRPKSKKATKEAVLADPTTVRIEATSVFGNEYDGPASGLPAGTKVYFVGPDPSTSRKFYGQLTRKADGSLQVK